MATSPRSLPIFVYGTLRPGGWNHEEWLAPHLAGPCRRAVLQGWALHFVDGLPSIVPDAVGRVVGDVAVLVEHAYEHALALLDHLEGVGNRHYERVEVDVPGIGPAWAWRAGPRIAARLGAATRVEHGDWTRVPGVAGAKLDAVTEIPTEHHKPPLRKQPSLVLVHTGDGKGKSTAAFGVILRAVARGWKVGVVQFLKSGDWGVGEEQICRDKLGVDWWAIGEGFTWDSEDLSKDEAVAREAWRQARSLIESGEHRLVVLDEITYPMNWGWIDTDEVLGVLRDRPEQVNVILTGRDAPAGLVDLADTVTEMRKVKHAYDSGVLAKKGIDY